MTSSTTLSTGAPAIDCSVDLAAEEHGDT